MNLQHLLPSGVHTLGQSRTVLTRASLTLALPVGALLVNEWLRPQLQPGFEPAMTAAVALVCWICGPLYGGAALILSALLFLYFFLPPYYSPVIADLNSALKFCFFLGTNGLIAGLIANLYNTRAALLRSQRIHRNLSELIPFGGWISDGEGNMVHLSDSFLSTFGLTEAEGLGLGWASRIIAAERDLVLDAWRKCVRDGYFWDFQYQMVSRNGEVMTVLSRGVPLTDSGGKAWVGMHLDITERERSLEEQVRQARDLARFNTELDQFAYVSAHDLQEPLRNISSYLQLLKRRYGSQLDAEADEFIEYAVEAASRLRSLLQDLMLLQNIGKSGREPEKHQLSKLVSAAVTNLGAQGADITVGELPEVTCQHHEFTQLFEHLIGNALKYARAGVKPVMSIAAKPAPGGVTVSVTDNGIGIAPEYRNRVFDVFQRLHSRTEYPGTGIGLAVCRKIVEVHGGRIWVESGPGETGSRFCFFLPDAVEQSAILPVH